MSYIWIKAIAKKTLIAEDLKYNEYYVSVHIFWIQPQITENINVNIFSNPSCIILSDLSYKKAC